MTSDRPRAWNSTLPPRSLPLQRSGWDRSVSGGGSLGGRVVPMRSRPQPVRSTIPSDVLALVDARDGHFCIKCGRWREVIEHHHRRIKGMGGSAAAHTECPCCIVSLCPWWTESACHPWAHRNRVLAEAEGLVVPRSALSPFLYSVLVHEKHDAGGQRAWPTCDGGWDLDEPEGCVA